MPRIKPGRPFSVAPWVFSVFSVWSILRLRTEKADEPMPIGRLAFPDWARHGSGTAVFCLKLSRV